MFFIVDRCDSCTAIKVVGDRNRWKSYVHGLSGPQTSSCQPILSNQLYPI